MGTTKKIFGDLKNEHLEKEECKDYPKASGEHYEETPGNRK